MYKEEVDRIIQEVPGPGLSLAAKIFDVYWAEEIILPVFAGKDSKDPKKADHQKYFN